MLKYILLTQKNLNLLQECYNILKQCGETMFKEHGLEHWLPAENEYIISHNTASDIFVGEGYKAGLNNKIIILTQ